jgi:hypothetical protein
MDSASKSFEPTWASWAAILENVSLDRRDATDRAVCGRPETRRSIRRKRHVITKRHADGDDRGTRHLPVVQGVYSSSGATGFKVLRETVQAGILALPRRSRGYRSDG